MKKLYLGVDIGGTKCAIVVGDIHGKIHERVEIPSSKDIPPQILISQFIDISQELINNYCEKGYVFASAGISCGGPLNSETGTIHAPPNLPLWDDIKIVSIFEENLGIPTYLQNDANACAVAEWQFGNGKRKDNVIFLTFGTGLGAGMILNGQLYNGTSGMAGEIGHIRLTESGPIGYHKAGSFEGYCSGGGIKQLAEIIARDAFKQGISTTLAKNEEAITNITAKTVFDHARKGDKIAMQVVDTCAENLGKGLAILIDVLNPDCIIIGSIFTKCEDMLTEKMNKVLSREALSQSLEVCEVLPSYLKENVGDYAAITVAIINENKKEVLSCQHV